MPNPGDRTTSEDAAALDIAVNALRRSRPDLSAGEPMWMWQKAALVGILPALGCAAIVAFEQAAFALAAMLVVPFACVVALRLLALRTAMADSEYRPGAILCPGEVITRLPRYSVLVPLYDEAEVVPDIVAALSALDYPAAALEIFLILEESDRATRDAVAAIRLPPGVRVTVVPDGEPRTKPRALNFALRQATGELLVIYDAEDLPEPDQLLQAAHRLAADPSGACVQARLNVLNAEETLLTRQFAIEYTVLFDCLLPTLDRLGLPVPLGGTSNHFRREALDKVGGWDPFNVTEDADLGIRLARSGRQVKVLASTTWEEAPAGLDSWMRQRTRWLKGWMQTYLVHMRHPWNTARELGWWRFLGFQVLMGGLLLSAIVHPWFYVIGALHVAWGPFTSPRYETLSLIVAAIGLGNLLLGYIAGVALGCVAVAKRGHRRLAPWALAMPAYLLAPDLDRRLPRRFPTRLCALSLGENASSAARHLRARTANRLGSYLLPTAQSQTAIFGPCAWDPASETPQPRRRCAMAAVQARGGSDPRHEARIQGRPTASTAQMPATA